MAEPMPMASRWLFMSALGLWAAAIGLLIIIIFPLLVRRLREAAIASAINRSTLFPESASDEQFRSLQLKALIYDCVEQREGITLRLSKLREVYLALDPRGRPKRFDQREIEKYGRKCLHELIDIVEREVVAVRPNVRLDGPIVYAKEFLATIANRDRAARSYPLIHQASDLETHFREFPLTIEQAGELLEAISYGLYFRRGAPIGLAADEHRLLDEIVRREQRLRSFVEREVRSAARSEEGVIAILRHSIKEEAFEGAMERASRGGGEINVFEGLFLDQLKQIITTRWDLFSKQLIDKKQATAVFETLAPIRNRLAHGRRVTSRDIKRAWAGCYQIDAWLEDLEVI